MAGYLRKQFFNFFCEQYVGVLSLFVKQFKKILHYQDCLYVLRMAAVISLVPYARSMWSIHLDSSQPCHSFIAFFRKYQISIIVTLSTDILYLQRNYIFGVIASNTFVLYQSMRVYPLFPNPLIYLVQRTRTMCSSILLRQVQPAFDHTL